MTQTNGHPTTPPIEAPLPKPITLERKLEVNVYDGNYCQESIEPTINDVQGWCFEHGHVAIGLDDPKLAAALGCESVAPSSDQPPHAKKPLVDKLPGRCGGVACIAGTRLYVSLLEGMRRRGVTIEWILVNYPFITFEQLTAAWRYADQNREEIDAELREQSEDDEPARDTERPPLSPESAAKLHAGIESAKNGESVCLGSFAEGAGKLPSERVKELAAQLAAKATKEGKFRDWGNPDDEDHWIGLLRMLDERLGPAKEKKSLRQAVEARLGSQFHSIGDAAMAKLNALIEVLEERLP